MTRILRVIIMAAILAVVGSIMNVDNAFADDCTQNCTTVDAIATTTTSSSSSSSSTTHIKVRKTVKEKIRHFERTRGVIVAMHVRAGGVKSQQGCVNPVSKGWIRTGGTYINSRKNGSDFWDRWKSSRQICHAKRVKNGNSWWMVGWKDNCSNKVRIQISGPRKTVKVKPVIEVRSDREFVLMYDKWIKTTTTKTGTSSTTTTYSCPVGWTPINGGRQCQLCAPTCVPIPPPPARTVKLVKYVFVDGSKVATPSGFGFTINGTGFSNTGETTSAPGSYQVGTTVTVCETNAMGYQPDTACQSATMPSGGLTFTFVNRKTTPPPPPPANRPPTVEIVGPQHVFVGGSVTYCVNASDPDGDSLSYLFSTNFGTITSNGACYLYHAPNTPGSATITVVVRDSKGLSASASTTFPVVKDDFGG